MAENKKFWTGFEQLGNTPTAQKMANKEFAEQIPVEDFLGNKEALESTSTSRRDFLKFLGFSTAAATVAACEAPVVESIPYVVKPDEITPGIPNYYATSYFDGFDFASVLVKTREGRPIKIEPNKDTPFNGGTNARLQASVLSLYDSDRLRGPMAGGESTDWDSAIDGLKKELDKAENAGKEIALLTSTIISPSTRRIFKHLSEKYTQFKHITYDAVSVSHKLDYYESATGVRALPNYDFKKAKVIVSFGSDFLNGLNGLDVESDYALRRKPGKDMSKHIQFEANLSLTGSNADQRIKIRHADMDEVMMYIFNEVSGRTKLPVRDLDPILVDKIKEIADLLKKNQGNSLVLAGDNNLHHERIATAINFYLGNLDETVIIADHVFTRHGNDNDVNDLIKSLNGNKVGVLMMQGVNPVYTMSADKNFAEALSKAGTSVCFSEKLDETSSLCDYSLPTNHYLESWGDAVPKTNHVSLTQPVIRPLFDTKQPQEVYLSILGENPDYHKFLRSFFDEKAAELGFSVTWNQLLHDGWFEIPLTAMDLFHAELEYLNLHTQEEFLYNLVVSAEEIKKEVNDDQYEINVYEKAGIGAGVLANNPHLQELPDPITRISWDNYITVSAADALELGIVNESESNGALIGSLVNIEANGVRIENVPALIQPGQTHKTLGLALGYGRTKAGKAADGVGVNAYAILTQNTSHIDNVKIEVAEGMHQFASVQLAHTMMGRKIVNETTLDKFLNDDPASWNEITMFHTHEGKKRAKDVTLWKEFDHETGHMWNMSIDLNSCTGCGACVVACHVENNVPVVGKDEIRRHRDMHWLRIDRYYSSDMNKDLAEESGMGAVEKYAKMEEPSSSPRVYFQPVMCQHCNHAPCETVCPVAATSHSAEGLNHMAYNRCIGTRYCANNCPYKVRRFNWFNYNANEQFSDVNPAQDDYGRMVLNPDVVVRSRGVMEKCSLCVQRIQYGKLEAKKEGRPVADGEIQTACAQACSTGAFTFGDVNDPESAVLEAKKDKRAYHLLEEIGVQPSVFYQTKVRNA